MKLIRCVVRPHKVDDIRRALVSVNAAAVAVTEVKDHGPQSWYTTVWLGREWRVDFLPKMELELVAHDDDVDEIVTVIIRAARTDGIAEGYVYVMPVEHRYNIHTGERNVS